MTNKSVRERVAAPLTVCGLIAIFCTILGNGGWAQAQTEHVYFGNLHSHTSYSDGSGLPEEAYKHAQNAGLDFMAITEHNHSLAESGAGDRKDGLLIATKHSLYAGPATSSLIPAAKRMTTPTFVALYGQEFSSISSGNHMNVFDVPEVIDEADVPNGSVDKLITDWLPSHKDSTGNIAILQLNHPADCSQQCIPKEYGQDDFDSPAAWLQALDPYVRLIEIENGPGLSDDTGLRGKRMEKGYVHYLSLGFHLAPVADQDNHYRTWGTLTDARTGVVAPALSKEAILAALRARHVYATEDKNLALVFHVNRGLVGDRLAKPTNGSELDIKYRIADGDESQAAYEIQPYLGKFGEEARMVNPVEASGDTGIVDQKLDGLVYDGSFDYVFFKVVQQQEEGGSDLSWTAPVWFDGGSATAVAAPAAEIDASGFVASVNSTVYHVSSACKDAQRIKPENRITGAAAKAERRQHDGCPR